MKKILTILIYTLIGHSLFAQINISVSEKQELSGTVWVLAGIPEFDRGIEPSYKANMRPLQNGITQTQFVIDLDNLQNATH